MQRYRQVACIVTGRQDANAEDAVTWSRGLCEALKIPSLSSYGITAEHIPTLVEKASAASSMKPNPVALTPEELEVILTRAL